MNKSKFKTVRFKPFDLPLVYLQRTERGMCWTNEVSFGQHLINDVYFSDSCIEAYPELFEVEKAEREFEPHCYYKAKFFSYENYRIVQYLADRFYFIGTDKGRKQHEFFEIGEKIEL